MTPEDLRTLLTDVASGTTNVDDATERLARLPFEDLGFARVDHHRRVRTGYPEVVYGPGKTPQQIASIVHSIRGAQETAIVTRVDPEKAEAARALLDPRHEPHLDYDPVSRMFIVGGALKKRGRGKIAIVAAGTSDLPVAEEAARTALVLGNDVDRLTDVGVAGLHRLLPARDRLEEAEIVIVVAGMEGALPSVVKGMISRPVIAVPTSVGFGASLNGIAALLGMLSSCSAGITVVNIDNGFGAGYAASLMNRVREEA